MRFKEKLALVPNLPGSYQMLDENNTELVTVKGVINELKPEESTVLNISMTSDFVDAYDFSVKVK